MMMTSSSAQMLLLFLALSPTPLNPESTLLPPPLLYAPVANPSLKLSLSLSLSLSALADLSIDIQLKC